MSNDATQYSKSIQEETNATSLEMRIVISGQKYKEVASTSTNTTSRSNPILVDDNPVELSKRLGHFLNSSGLTFSVKAAELLFMCTGLEGSKHSEIIKKALQVDDIASSPSTGFSSYDFTAHDHDDVFVTDNSSADQSKQDMQTELSSSTSNLPELRLLPNALKNFEIAFFSALSKVVNKSEILQPLVTHDQHQHKGHDHDKLLQVLKKYRNDSANHNSLMTSTNVAGLLNLWDIGLNRSVRPFLETIGGCFTDHVALFLFINIKDIDKLYTPPNRHSVSSEDFSWRPKIQYLLRPVCQLMSEKSTKVKCTIFLTYDSSNTKEKLELEKAYQRLSSVCAVAFQQMEIKLEEKLEFEVCKIAHNENCILLLEKMQSYTKEMKKTDIPCSHLLLRCILACAFQNEVCIKREELQDIAKYCSGFRPQDLTKFCESFTAFGSIIDVGQINPDSDHIIIKPSAFLDGLKRYIKKINEDGSVQTSPSISNLSEKQIVEVLVDIGMAYRYTDGLEDLPKLSSAFAFDHHVKHNERAIQFISSMGTPRLNINIDLMKYLISNIWPRYKILHQAANATTIRIPLDSPSPVQPIIDHIDICFTFLANVIEISFDAPKHINIPVSHIRAVCGEVIAAFKQIIIKKRKQRNNSSIKYHFAILCKKDGIHGVYNAYRIRHVLPEKLCEDCYQIWEQDEINLMVADVWRQLLEQGMDDHEKANDERYSIPHELKLNGDLTMDNIVMLSRGLAENFDWKAVKILANELEVMIIKKDPVTVHRKELIILEILVRWEHDNYRRKPESLRKIMARKLLDAAEKCETLTKEKGSLQLKADFKKLARDLDMTVLTKEQRKELNPTEPAKQE